MRSLLPGLAAVLLLATIGCQRPILEPEIPTQQEGETGKQSAHSKRNELDKDIARAKKKEPVLYKGRGIEHWRRIVVSYDPFPPSGSGLFTDPDAIPLLLELLDLDDELVRAHGLVCLSLLAKHAKTAIPRIIEALEDKSENVRSAAANALGAFGPEAGEQARAALLQELEVAAQRDPFPFADALWKITGDSQLVMPTMLRILPKWRSSKDIDIYYLTLLEEIGPAAKDAAPELIRLLEVSQDWNRARAHCARALGQIGPAAKSGIPALIAALRKTSADSFQHDCALLRVAAAEAVWNIDQGAVKTDELIAVLQEALSNNLEAKEWAIRALGSFGPRANKALPDIVSLLDDIARRPELGSYQIKRYRDFALEAIQKIDMNEYKKQKALLDQK